jgi:site-specific DNA-cytosine methylase
MKPQSKFDWSAAPDTAASKIFYGRVVREAKPNGPTRLTRTRGEDLEGLRLTRTDAADFGEARDAPPVLCINSYAGSLVQAAKDCGLRVLGSYEDAAYGLDVQRLNFPELEGLWAGHRRAWPDASLEGAIVFAHPPCAAFSAQQSSNVTKRLAAGNTEKITGVTAAKFQCTIDVVDYALSKKPMALAIESVPRAFTLGAREVHEAKAAHHGYKIFNVLQNAVMFGVPQWRPRYWAVYMRPDRVRERMAFVDFPEFVPFSSIMDGGEPFADHIKRMTKQRVFVEQAAALQGFDPAAVLDADEDGRIMHVLARYGAAQHPDWTKDDVEAWKKRCHVEFTVNGKFDAQALMLLARSAVATTLVHNSWWWCAGQLASKTDFNVAMGFPRSYAFPPGKAPSEQRGLLSRGVCPPVASWLLETIIATIQGKEPPLRDVTWAEHNGVADLSPDIKTRKGLLAKAEAQ